jgi:hypothetical protein
LIEKVLQKKQIHIRKIMKLKTLFAAIVGLALAAVTSQAALTLNFSSTVSSTIQFNGAASTFQFNNSPGSFGGNQWWITSEVGGTGSGLGLLGEVLNGPFSYGAITTSGNEQTASVIGPLGGLVIHDGSGNDLTGTVDWMNVETFNSIGGLNSLLNVNVTDLAYAGLNQDLLSLVALGGGTGSMNVSFQFNPGQTLTQLSTGAGPYETSYSGSLSAVPEPTTIIAGALLLLPFGASTLRILRRNRMA